MWTRDVVASVFRLAQMGSGLLEDIQRKRGRHIPQTAGNRTAPSGRPAQSCAISAGPWRAPLSSWSKPWTNPLLWLATSISSDIGTDLFKESHDKLCDLFRQVAVRQDLRAFARDHGRRLGTAIDKAREAVQDWLKPSATAEHRLPEGFAGVATLRAYAQWALDYAADGDDQGFPFELPYLDFYVRCMNVFWAVDASLRNPPAEAKVKMALNRLHRILSPLNCDVPPFDQIARTLNERFKLFTELRTALRLVVKSEKSFFSRICGYKPVNSQPMEKWKSPAKSSGTFPLFHRLW